MHIHTCACARAHSHTHTRSSVLQTMMREKLELFFDCILPNSAPAIKKLHKFL